MNYKDLAIKLIEYVGGVENVDKVVHCATRLRFTLKDDSKANTEVIKKTKGVLSVVNAGGQYQIVIGPDVPQVYQEVIAAGKFDTGLSNSESNKTEDNRSKISKVLESIASIFQPIIPALTGAGLLKAFMSLFVTMNILDNASQTYAVLNGMADAVFYFLPILLAASAAKSFKCNQGVAMALGAILVHPNLVALFSDAKAAGEAISFLGLPITPATYSSSVIPILLGVWFMSIVEHSVQKVAPKAIKFFAVPLSSLFIAGTVTLVVLGPIGTWVGDGLAALLTALDNMAGWVVPTIIGIVSPLMVMTGTHYGLIPIGVNNLATMGFDTFVGPGMLTSNVAQGAAGFAVAFRTKNKETKQLAASTSLTGMLGITEPVLYGVNLKFVYPLVAAMIGGGVGGFYLGIMGVGRYASGAPGLLVLPCYIGGVGMSNFIHACIGTAIAGVVAFIAALILFDVWAKKGKLDPSETTTEEEMTTTPVVENVVAATVAEPFVVNPINGIVKNVSEAPDEVFASGAMGQGVVIEPTEGKVYAPCSGKIKTIFNTLHAIGIIADNGAEILIHIGMDTVKLGGQGFKSHIKTGDRIEKGHLMMEFDMAFIQSKGCSLATPMIITNTDNFTEINLSTGNKRKGETIFSIQY